MSDFYEGDDKPSKSQRKRDMDALKDLAWRLTDLPNEQRQRLADPEVLEAVEAARKITKGNAKKRQIQYIAKLLSRVDTGPYQKIIDMLDASTAEYVRRFHQLEQWREQKLVQGSDQTMTDILAAYPATDRQQLRQLVRAARKEHEQGMDQANFKRLFQFLKTLDAQDD